MIKLFFFCFCCDQYLGWSILPQRQFGEKEWFAFNSNIFQNSQHFQHLQCDLTLPSPCILITMCKNLSGGSSGNMSYHVTPCHTTSQNFSIFEHLDLLIYESTEGTESNESNGSGARMSERYCFQCYLVSQRCTVRGDTPHILVNCSF